KRHAEGRDNLRLSSIIAYCSPGAQELLGLNTGEKVQELPGVTPEKLATRKRRWRRTRSSWQAAASTRCWRERCSTASAPSGLWTSAPRPRWVRLSGS